MNTKFALFLAFIVVSLHYKAWAAKGKPENFDLPTMQVKIEVTKKAKIQLKSKGHFIKIMAYIHNGENTEGVSLGQKGALLVDPSGGVVKFTPDPVPSKLLEGKSFEPHVLINVSSSKGPDSKNILKCSTFQGKYPPKGFPPIPILCDA